MSDFGRVRVVFFSNPVFDRLSAELSVDGDELADIVWQADTWKVRFVAHQRKISVPAEDLARALRWALDELAKTSSPEG